MKNRSRTDITAQILEVASSGPVTKSMIMYKAFLSYAQLKDYLGTLGENGLIKYVKEENKYMTTEKGLKLMKAMGEFQRLRI
jgi:predicted transcriptional regulator